MKIFYRLIKKIPDVQKIIKKIKSADLEETLNSLFKKEEKLLLIDVGANTGQTIDFFYNTFPYSKIYSFEPTPELYQKLITTYKSRNDLKITNSALGSETSKANFYTTKFSPTNSLLKPNLVLYEKYNPEINNVLSKQHIIKVPVIRFDEWYKGNIKDQIIDIFKTDTQGYDYNVLEGAGSILSEKVKTIIVEVQYQKFYQNAEPFYKTIELLYTAGFKIYNILSTSRINRVELLESDCIFINEKYIISELKK
ncbi:MAG: FkbM family methyltransferase [Ignavibacteriales bacterium]|nr:FkbM family methyltransferase [Ignavibacteriales bacterium]